MKNNEQIRLLYVITKLELGGAQKQLLTLIQGLDKEKFVPFLFTAKEGILIQEAAGIPSLKLKRSNFLERSIHPLKDFAALVELYFFIKRNKIDVVHTHSSKAGILGRLAAKLAAVEGVLHTVHGWSFNDYQPKALRLIYIFLERLCARFSDKLIVVSQWDKTQGLKNNIGSESKYILIRYGINPDFFKNNLRKVDLKKKLGLAASDMVIGMVACFKKQKAPLDFVKLAGLLKKISPEAKFILVGDGLLRKRIVSLIKNLGLENDFILTGWSDDLVSILPAFDIFVLTSLWEGLAIAVLEAMASSIAVVATDTGGIREVILDGKTGYLVKRGDIQNMLERTRLLLQDKELRANLGISASQLVNAAEFSVANMVQVSQQLYSNTLEERRKCLSI